ncbi:MAG: hypothetical protein IBV53_08610 [Candidatus Atribacteria bacterium]
MSKKLNKINKKAKIANQAFWDEIAPVHYKSYDIEKLKQGKSLIDVIQKKEIGSVKDKSLLHLQCHIGTEFIILGVRRCSGDRSRFFKGIYKNCQQIEKNIRFKSPVYRIKYL